MLFRACALLVCGAATAGVASAADIGITGKLFVVDNPVDGKARLVFKGREETPGTFTKGAGTDVGDIEATFQVTYRNGAAAGSFTIPIGASDGTAGWIVNSDKVAKYVNNDAPGGPTQVRTVVIHEGEPAPAGGKVRLTAPGLGDQPFDVLSAGPPAGTVYMAFCATNSGEENCYCSATRDCSHQSIADGTGVKLRCQRDGVDPVCRANCGFLTDLGTTVMDPCTGLEWEKKDAADSTPNPTNAHDVDNAYSWAGRCDVSAALCQPTADAEAACRAQTDSSLWTSGGCNQCGVGEGTCDVDPLSFGAITTVWDWIDALNDALYAGHGDWRLPTHAELQSILDHPVSSCPQNLSVVPTLEPCIESLFGPTNPDQYQSGSTPPLSPDRRLDWHFGLGNVGVPLLSKISPADVRAVR